MFIFDATPEAVKPAAATVLAPAEFRAWMDEAQAFEADARDLADEPTDAEWDAMADEAAAYAMYESGLGSW